MKKLISILALFVAFSLSAQIQNFNIPIRLKTVDNALENDSMVLILGESGIVKKIHKDSLGGNHDVPLPPSIWDWDSGTGNLTVAGSSGVGNTSTNLLSIGAGSGLNNLASDVVAIGTNAGRSLTSGMDNSVIIGRETISTPTLTGSSAWHGGNSIYLGYNTAKNIQSTYQDVYIGEGAGMNAGISATGANQYSGQNVAIGLAAFRDGRGVGNILIGGKTVSNTPFGAGRNMIGSDNIILGSRAFVTGQGNGNIVMGYAVGSSLNGSENIMISGSAPTTGSSTGNTHRNTAINAKYPGSAWSPTGTQSGYTAIGYNLALYANGVERKASIFPVVTGSLEEPRERLDLGTDGYLAGAGVKFDNSTFQVTLNANTLTGNHAQKLQDASGTIALLEDVNSAYQKGFAIYTLLTDATWNDDGSILLSLDAPIDEAIWSGAYGWEIWRNDGTNNGTTIKTNLLQDIGKANITAINSGNRLTGGGFSLSLNVSSPFTLPAGTELVIKLR